MTINSAIVINHKHLDWIRRNPRVFVNGLISRLEQGETDPFPGHARWNGDAMPGVQVVFTGHSNTTAVLLVGGNAGKKMGSAGPKGRASVGSDVDALKSMASRLGYNVRKRPTAPINPVKTAAASKKVPGNKRRKRKR